MAQPVPSHYYKLWQKDSLYYFLTDKGVFKYYSSETSGEFFLTEYIDNGNFSSDMTLILMDDYLILRRNNSTIEIYSNTGPWDLTYCSTYNVNYAIKGLVGFGPYFLIRTDIVTDRIFNICKIQNGQVVLVQDSLLNLPHLNGLYFTYPYVIWGETVYKYVEDFGLYGVGQINLVSNTGLTGNTFISYLYWIDQQYPYTSHSVLRKLVIEEPSFPVSSITWGTNIGQIHCSYCTGTMIVRKNLYYMTWVNTITTADSHLAYLPSTDDQVWLTDNYIFLLGDSVKFSKWYEGSHFYPFTWTDFTEIRDPESAPDAFNLFQNYPNPFNPVTNIKYQLPGLSKVNITVYDLLGSAVECLVNEEKTAGSYEVKFNGTDLPSGVYFYRIETDRYSDTKKLLLLK